MRNLRAGNNIRAPIYIDSSDDSSSEEQFSSVTIQTATSAAHKITDSVRELRDASLSLDKNHAPTVESSAGQFQNLIGFHVSKRFAGGMHEGLVASRNNETGMFKVMYFNGYAEEMGLEDLMGCLVPHKQPVQPFSAELPRNDKFGEDMAQSAPAQPVVTQQIGSTVIPSGALDNQLPGAYDAPPPVADELSPPRPGPESRLRDLSRKCMQVASNSRSLAEEDEEPNYPLPPLIKVPWPDETGETSAGSRHGKPHKRVLTTNPPTTSLRIRASYYPGDGHEIEYEESNDEN